MYLVLRGIPKLLLVSRYCCVFSSIVIYFRAACTRYNGDGEDVAEENSGVTKQILFTEYSALELLRVFGRVSGVEYIDGGGPAGGGCGATAGLSPAAPTVIRAEVRHHVATYARQNMSTATETLFKYSNWISGLQPSNRPPADRSACQ